MENLRYRFVKKILWVILFANFAVAAAKIGIGIACGSQSVSADGIHSIADGASNVVGLVGIWLSARPRDKKHPYGHQKYEILASLFIGLMLVAIACRILWGAMASFAQPKIFAVNMAECVILGATILINTVVAVTEYRFGKKYNSLILITDSLHTRSDIFISCAVLGGIVGMAIGWPVWVDGLLSVLVAGTVLLSAFAIIKNCVAILADSRAVNDDEICSLRYRHRD